MPYWTTTYIDRHARWADAGPDRCRRRGRLRRIRELPDPDPVDPTPPGSCRISQVTNWTANYNGAPGGSGSLQYTVTNTGIATAPAGSFVALIAVARSDLHVGATCSSSTSRSPSTWPPGTTAYRDANNSIAFNFPGNLEPGQYYMAAWADMWDDVVESDEDDNISPATSMIDIVNTLPDMEVVSWYAHWDELGLRRPHLRGRQQRRQHRAPTGWLITLALSPDDIIGDGDEIFLFSEPADFALDPGGTLYRDDASAGVVLALLRLLAAIPCRTACTTSRCGSTRTVR